jgi:tetratricopeptide (TPR) repeat protein
LTADQDLDAQLVDLAVKARWIAPESEHRFKLEIARHRLRSVSDCLIVFDNLEDAASIQGYLPELPAAPHILVTSRVEQPDFISVPIDLLDPDQSVRMLVQEARREPDGAAEWAAAREIAGTLAGLPLALELAGAYLSRRPVEFRRYLELLRHNLRQALPPRIASLTSHEADLYSTLQVSEGVFAEEPLLQPVLDVLTWSGPAPMGVDLLAALVGVADRAELTGALGLGTALCILQPVPGVDRYGLHRLVREVRREQFPLADRPDWAEELCGRVDAWFGALRQDFLQLPRFEAEIDHLREWHDHACRFASNLVPRLTWLQAYPPFHQGRPREIQRCVERALVEYAQQGCEDMALLACLYNDFGYSVARLGDPKRALELADLALSIRRDIFGDAHPDTAISINNIASATCALGDPRQALDLAQQALVIQRELFGDRHPDTARSLDNVATYINALGDPQRALGLAKEALAIRRELFGERHPDTARSLDNVATYTNTLGNPQRALELAEQALVIRRVLFGERHPDIALSLHHMACHLRARGDAKGAHSKAKAAYDMRRQLLGCEHPATLESARLLAGINRPGFRIPSSKKGNAARRRKKPRR